MHCTVMSLQQANDLASHRWTAYVRGNGNEDITHIVQKVCLQ
jgi:transcription initiation factor IIF auxiliary subunit